MKPLNIVVPLVVSLCVLSLRRDCVQALEFQPGDHVCLVGNALGERMQHQNYFETLLHREYAERELVVRNLCFPGDEVTTRLRSLNFGTPDDHLAHSKASVILFFFGYNESFAGEQGVAPFVEQLSTLVRNTRQKNYSGKGAPQIVLVSPISFEDTGNPHLPDSNVHNQRLKTYVDAMRRVATESDVDFVDLFRCTQRMFREASERYTLNGFHLNEAGYRALAPHFLAEITKSSDAKRPYSEPTWSELVGLRTAIADKSFHWWHRYRAVNGYSIYGNRRGAGFDGTYRNESVMERERAILDQMCANRDRRIWLLAAGKEVPPTVDDSQTLPFFEPKTNVEGPDGKGPRYLSSDEQKQHFKLAPGYVVDLIASEEDIPDMVNPVAINFDADGRLWVATMPSYPQWKPKTPLDDKLIILNERDEQGRYHGSHTFAGGLHQPTGFELGYGGVFVAQQPDVLFLRDTDGDDRADHRVRKLIGFDTADSHHGLAAFEWGPGGGLYFQEGTFKQSQVETAHGVERLSDAGVWRYDPRTEDFRVFVSVPFANPWGHVFDRWGQDFLADASDGLNYWAAPISGFLPYPKKHPGGWIANKGWDKLPLIVPRKRRPSSGCELVATRQFPESVQGNYLLNNVIGFQGVLQHTLSDSGAGYAGKEIEPLIYCEDANFRPVDLQFGPDGALYIVDWHNALIGHLQHNLRDPNRDRSHGRIWRVRYESNALLPIQKLSTKPTSEILPLLMSPEDRTRYRARRELQQRESGEVLGAVHEWLGKRPDGRSATEEELLAALWLHQSHDHLDEGLLRELLEAQRFQVRAAAVRVLSFWVDRLPDVLELIKPRIADKHPRVRLEAVRACSFLEGSDQVAEAVLNVLEADDTDPWIEYTLEETMRGLGR